ncbi:MULTISPECIES: LysE family transporter [Pseudomonas]|uniref:Threonine/homoserine/homoserine lactone efflux protein n=1 Tax=Pseudomonas hunanensis TaxID=1247546 RepID=A0ACC6JYA3_9PSED|nr:MULTISPECIES: LysE family transporter [Pseudomonas]MBP2263006.1 threonine/homoserine/homoserine lactone efflux protein [Pseudomonas sp. BP8]MDR6711189.1 threonine/homoserine/homoserine lactone efflux protein [Pseudomonas hunanensis]HDS1735882.1 LysE family transporter [Pseudomonas putida]
MLGVTDYGAFVIAFLILLAIPGPGNFALITATGKGGIKGGLAATCGVILGDQVLMWLAVAGVATLLAAYPAAFHVVQWAGAAYLAWLGLRMVLSKPGKAPQAGRMDNGQYLRQTMMITLLNPKAIMFYMAFFPLFVDPVRHQGMLTFGFMAVTIAALTLLYGLVAVVMTHLLAERMRASPKMSNLLERLAGACLVGFGIKLAAMR